MKPIVDGCQVHYFHMTHGKTYLWFYVILCDLNNCLLLQYECRVSSLSGLARRQIQVDDHKCVVSVPPPSGPNTGSNPEEGRVLNKKNKKTGSYNWFIGGAYINIIILKNYHFYSIQKLKKNQFQIFPYVLVQKLYKITYTKGGLASFTNLIRF